MVRVRTIIAFIAIYNTLFLSHVFLILFRDGSYLITEGNKWAALTEFYICIFLIGLIGGVLCQRKCTKL